MKKIFATDIKDISTFERAGYRYEKLWEDTERHLVIWGMNYKEGSRYNNFELWLGKKTTNPDGKVVYCKPKDEDWGAYGWSYYGSKEWCFERMQEKIAQITPYVEEN